jgi:hypothetical protein
VTDEPVAPTTAASIELARAAEALRQQGLLFDRRLEQDRHWFRVRVGLAAIAAVVVVVVLAAGLIMIWSDQLPTQVRTAGAVALVADVLTIAVATWKAVIGDGNAATLATVTRDVPFDDSDLSTG